MTTDIIKTVTCSSINELIAELLPSSGLIWKGFRDGGPRPEWIFRGQGDEIWTLRPSAFRPNAFVNLPEPKIALDTRRFLEVYHVLEFAHLADILGHGIPADDPRLRDGRPRQVGSDNPRRCSALGVIVVALVNVGADQSARDAGGCE